MTRRNFVRKMLETWPAAGVIVSALARKASAQKAKLRRFVRAHPMGWYPGPVKPLQDIHKQSKWSG